MKFKNIHIIGYGVMGRLLRQRIDKFYGGNIVVSDRGEGIIIPDGTEEGPSLVIIATPISAVTSICEQIATLNPRHTHVCDVASTKSNYMRWRNIFKSAQKENNTLHWGSYHPMVGPLAKDWDVKYWGRKCLQARLACSVSEHNILMNDFWRDLGFKVEQIDHERHDVLIGKLSHLSHYLILKYVEFIESNMSKKEIALAGTSFEKFKEMADGARRLGDIYESNKHLPELVKEFEDFLKM